MHQKKPPFQFVPSARAPTILSAPTAPDQRLHLPAQPLPTAFPLAPATSVLHTKVNPPTMDSAPASCCPPSHTAACERAEALPPAASSPREGSGGASPAGSPGPRSPPRASRASPRRTETLSPERGPRRSLQAYAVGATPWVDPNEMHIDLSPSARHHRQRRTGRRCPLPSGEDPAVSQSEPSEGEVALSKMLLRAQRSQRLQALLDDFTKQRSYSPRRASFECAQTEVLPPRCTPTYPFM